jgi:hypothetical protein
MDAADRGHSGWQFKLVLRPRRNLKPTKPAIEISDADRKRKILITDKCTMAFNFKLKKWREKGESFRVDRYRCIESRSGCL